MILDRETSRSRGFGFVTLLEPEAARDAIQAMNGTALDGRNIKVDEAEERPRTGSAGGGGNSRGRSGNFDGNRW